MADNLYPTASRELNQARQALAPETNDAFAAFSRSVFKEGALDATFQACRTGRACPRGEARDSGPVSL